MSLIFYSKPYKITVNRNFHTENLNSPKIGFGKINFLGNYTNNLFDQWCDLLQNYCKKKKKNVYVIFIHTIKRNCERFQTLVLGLEWA